MSEAKPLTLRGIPETLLTTLYLRALETQRPDALIMDEKAVELVNRLSANTTIRYDFERVRRIPLSETNRLVIILRNRQIDRRAQEFLRRHPISTVVHIGCGLDARFERLDNGQVEWFDLDLPDVIALRRRLIGDERDRYHLLGCSVFDDAWMEALSAHRRQPVLFLAEGVFMYFDEAQVKSLVLKLRDHFPGVELVFDIHTPLHNLVSNIQLTRSLVPHLRWGMWSAKEVESWAAGIRLLDVWGFFDEPTPRLKSIRWFRPLESLFRTQRIYHFQLGYAEGFG